MSKKLRVGILGGTGMVGQRFISLLDNHPWFEVTTIAASPRSAGQTYAQAVEGRWKLDEPIPEAVRNIVVKSVQDVEDVASEVDFCFSAVDMSKEEIRAIEEAYAKTETPVVSNNSAHRWTPDVPMVIPEIKSIPSGNAWAASTASSPSSPTAPSRAIHPRWRPGRSSSPMRSSYPPIRQSPVPARILPPGRKWSAT